MEKSFYREAYPKYLLKFLDKPPCKGFADIPVNHKSNLDSTVPEKDQKLFLVYLYIESLIDQILYTYFDGSEGTTLGGRYFPKLNFGLMFHPHPNCIFTTDSMPPYSLGKSGNFSYGDKNLISEHIEVVIEDIDYKNRRMHCDYDCQEIKKMLSSHIENEMERTRYYD